MRHLELHILQSVPVACLNRDDLGSPKTAIFGGVQRARVSSQCWKRAIREYCNELLPQRFSGERTRLIVEPLRDIFIQKHGMDEATALGNAKNLAEAVAKFDAGAAQKGKLQTKTLFFTSRSELEALAAGLVANQNVKKHAKNFAQSLCTDAADIALFGRMVASAPDLTLEGSAMFSHALSTHKADNEIDFFSALDDMQPAEDTGAGMTGTLEFNAATYYRFLRPQSGHAGGCRPPWRAQPGGAAGYCCRLCGSDTQGHARSQKKFHERHHHARLCAVRAAR